MQTYFDTHIEKEGISFGISIDPLLPDIETDNLKLIKVLRHLLDNAIRFTEFGSISVELLSLDDDLFPVECRISDTGVGIPADKVNLIFGAFRQLNESTKRSYDGLGLGLTLARSYVHLLGGEISLSSQEGVGTTVSIKLPKSPLQVKSERDINSSNTTSTIQDSTSVVMGSHAHVAAVQATDSGNDKAILLVDDDYRNQYAMKAMIEEAKGSKVLIAQDGAQAIQLLKDHPEIQLVITDIAMPEMDGYDLIHYIRENKVLAYLPIIAVTAMPETDKDKILSSGANAYLRKPITMDKFFQLLKHCKDANSICA